MTESTALVGALEETGFTQIALAAMHGAVQSEQKRRAGHPFAFAADIRLLNPRGTAGRAIGWFREAAHEGGTPAEIVERFAERCDTESAKAPGFYTKRHLLTMIRTAGEIAERYEEAS